MTQALDYSSGRLTAAQIKAAGFVGALRYLRKKTESTVIVLNSVEMADFRDHGLSLALIYEDGDARWMLGGRATGIDRAEWALQQAAAVGIAEPRCIYLAADHHATESEVAVIMACLDGARTVLGPATGIYGFAEVISAAMAGRHADWFWQTGRRSDLVAGAHLYQHNNDQQNVDGITCDINDVLKPDWGQWPHQEDDMYDTAAEGRLLAAIDASAQKWAKFYAIRAAQVMVAGHGNLGYSDAEVPKGESVRDQLAVLLPVLARTVTESVATAMGTLDAEAVRHSGDGAAARITGALHSLDGHVDIEAGAVPSDQTGDQ